MYNNDSNAEKQALTRTINGNTVAKLSDQSVGKDAIRGVRLISPLAQIVLPAKPKLLLPDKIKGKINEQSSSSMPSGNYV